MGVDVQSVFTGCRYRPRRRGQDPRGFTGGDELLWEVVEL